MTLPVGKRLGRYEIRSLLGASGMGEVYLAHGLANGSPRQITYGQERAAVGHRREMRLRMSVKRVAALESGWSNLRLGTHCSLRQE